MTEPKFLTVGQIADKLDVPLHRVTYVIRARAIEPAADAGQYRLFDQRALQQIQVELATISARRKKKGRQ